MASQAIQNSTADSAVPEIVVTEPSPLSQNGSVAVPVADKAVPTPEQSAKVPSSAVISAAEPDLSNTPDSSDVEVISEEFTSAQDCAECVVPVSGGEPEEPPIPSDSLENDQDDFRTPSRLSFHLSCLSCRVCYQNFCDRIPHRWRIPLWLIILVLPLSAGIMSSLYMFSCPAANALPHSIFITAIAGMAVVTARLCTVLHRITGNEEGDLKQTLRTLLLIATFVFLLFFSLESLIYWQVNWTSSDGSDKFCDPDLMNFMFVWNIVMYVALIPILFFPA